MSGGSQQAEGPHDKQCPHCGLFYQDKGVSFQMHTTACDGNADDEDEPDPDATASVGKGTEKTEPDPSDDPTMGSGKTPDTSDTRELPCGCYEIDISEYDPGYYECDDCGNTFRLQ